MPVNPTSGIPLICLAVAGLILIVPCSSASGLMPGTDITLARGDPLTVTGTGYTNGSAAIWAFGPGFFAYDRIPAAPDGTLGWTQGRNVTGTFRSGPLMILVQDPGRDRQYSVYADTSGETKRIMAGNGTDLFVVQPESLNATAATALAERVLEEIAMEGSDDSVTLRRVFVELPTLRILNENPGGVPAVAAGTRIRFSGTTNLAAEDRVTARIEDTAVIEKTGSHIPVRTGTVTTTRTGELLNRWEYTLDTSGLEPGEYLVEIGWERSMVTGQDAEVFRVVRPQNTSSGSSQPGSGTATWKSPFIRTIPPSAPVIAPFSYWTTSLPAEPAFDNCTLQDPCAKIEYKLDISSKSLETRSFSLHPLPQV